LIKTGFNRKKRDPEANYRRKSSSLYYGVKAVFVIIDNLQAKIYNEITIINGSVII